MSIPTGSHRVKISGATVNQTPLDWSGNLNTIVQAIEEAKRKHVKILCFPELCITGYGCEDLFLSDWLCEQAWSQVEKLKSYCSDIIVCVGLPLRIKGVTYNGVCVIDNQKIIGVTLKQNLAIDGVHYETRWFEKWVTGKVIELTLGGSKIPVGDVIYEAAGIRFGFEICEDAWRKDRAGLHLIKRNVDLILNPSASHYAMGKSVTREKLVTDSSVQLNCTYVYVNMLGNEAGRIIYDGDILIAQHGKLLAQNHRLSFQEYNLVTCEVDFKNGTSSEQHILSDNKEINEELAQAITLALFDYLRKSKAKGFVVSLSGGADSSMCAVIVAEMIKRASIALGWEKFCAALNLNPLEISDIKKTTKKLLTCAYQATINSSDTTLHAAQSLANSIDAAFHSWSIQNEAETYTQKIEVALNRKLEWATDDITLQNIQARSRSPIIWMLANATQSILLTTSNRSEGAVGYATMDGDTSGSLAPIAGIDKPFIIQWLKWAEQNLGYTGLHSVNSLKPTAELRPPGSNQTDETDLMPYTTLVEIEHHAILDRKSPLGVFNAMKETHTDTALLKAHIKKFFKLWSINQWKRERFAPSFHLDEHNVDPRSWCRFPILSGGFEEEIKALEKA
jgi:NAD+ synthase (glutamine-hydrolysing)